MAGMLREGGEPGGTDRDGGSPGPRSVARLLALFDALSQAADGLTLAELSLVLGSPKSSLLNLLRPLVAESYLIHDGQAYRLGPSIFRLAAGVLEGWELPKVVRPMMRDLCHRTGESVLLGVMDATRGTVTYVEAIDSPHPVRYEITVGTERPLYASTPGRVLLAYAVPRWRNGYCASVEFTVETVVPATRAALRRELDRIRAEGVGWSIDTFRWGVASIAAPVFDAAERCVASFSIAGPSDRFRRDLEARKRIVAEAAARASEAVAAMETAARPATPPRPAGARAPRRAHAGAAPRANAAR